ncbi:MAG: hypothetical protein ACK5LK_01700 [Chthoniobacterales bacterium]
MTMPEKKKSSTVNSSPAEKPNRRHAQFLGLNRKEQLLLAEYGPDAITNPTFPFVLQISRCRSPKANNFDEDYTAMSKQELFKELEQALDTGDAEIFRKLASALESVARVEKGEYYNSVARELLLADRREGYAIKGLWGADLVTRKSILVRARRKVRDGENDGQYRNLDRLTRTLDVVLGKAKRGRPKKQGKQTAKIAQK